MMFHGTECKHCIEMEPLVKKLEKELNVKVDKIETWHNAANDKKLKDLDKGKCGGVPFFYNKKTKATICGSTSYANLKKWATG